MGVAKPSVWRKVKTENVKCSDTLMLEEKMVFMKNWLMFTWLILDGDHGSKLVTFFGISALTKMRHHIMCTREDLRDLKTKTILTTIPMISREEHLKVNGQTERSLNALGKNNSNFNQF